MLIPLSILALAAALIMAGCKASRAGYESAPYKVVRSSGHFEVRDYAALRIVETPMTGGGSGADGSFNRLFRFITGANEGKQKIAMTTPVFMSGNDANATMAFVLPAKFQKGEVPRPKDGSLRVRELEAGRFAVLQYSGRRSASQEAATLEQLKTWMASEGMKVLSPPVYGYFDPPWTPGFIRRNEVMLRTGAGR